MALIKAGYRLTVKSWENDGDYKNTIQQDGMGLEDVKFIVEILSHYRFALGNVYNPTDKQFKEEKAILRKIVDKYPNAQRVLGLLDEEDMKIDEAIVETVHSAILGKFLGYSTEFYTRKCESYTVEYVPHEINIEDVTLRLASLKE